MRYLLIILNRLLGCTFSGTKYLQRKPCVKFQEDAYLIVIKDELSSLIINSEIDNSESATWYYDTTTNMSNIAKINTLQTYDFDNAIGESISMPVIKPLLVIETMNQRKRVAGTIHSDYCSRNWDIEQSITDYQNNGYFFIDLNAENCQEMIKKSKLSNNINESSLRILTMKSFREIDDELDERPNLEDLNKLYNDFYRLLINDIVRLIDQHIDNNHHDRFYNHKDDIVNYYVNGSGFDGSGLGWNVPAISFNKDETGTLINYVTKQLDINEPFDVIIPSLFEAPLQLDILIGSHKFLEGIQWFGNFVSRESAPIKRLQIPTTSVLCISKRLVRRCNFTHISATVTANADLRFNMMPIPSYLKYIQRLNDNLPVTLIDLTEDGASTISANQNTEINQQNNASVPFTSRPRYVHNSFLLSK